MTIVNSHGADGSTPKRVMVYRLGSIGDFVVALPSLHAIRRRLPNAQIALLTNRPIDARAAPAESLLENMNLIDRYFYYQSRTTVASKVRHAARQIREWSPDMLIYLAEPRGTFSIYRDYLFFRGCGVSSIVGMPFDRSMRVCPPQGLDGELMKSEAQRLADCLRPDFGLIAVDDAKNWDLHLSEDETLGIQQLLRDRLGPRHRKLPLIGISVGTKQSINDWGSANWQAMLEGLKATGYGLVLVGAAEDRERSETLAQCWPMPIVNLCGHLSPRASAAALREVDVFICHDSGPMHLASAVGTRCVAIFSRNNPPGKWFPAGAGHKVLYPPSAGETIHAIRPAEVIAAVHDALGSSVPVSTKATGYLS